MVTSAHHGDIYQMEAKVGGGYVQLNSVTLWVAAITTEEHWSCML